MGLRCDCPRFRSGKDFQLQKGAAKENFGSWKLVKKRKSVIFFFCNLNFLGDVVLPSEPQWCECATRNSVFLLTVEQIELEKQQIHW